MVAGRLGPPRRRGPTPAPLRAAAGDADRARLPVAAEVLGEVRKAKTRGAALAARRGRARASCATRPSGWRRSRVAATTCAAPGRVARRSTLVPAERVRGRGRARRRRGLTWTLGDAPGLARRARQPRVDSASRRRGPARRPRRRSSASGRSSSCSGRRSSTYPAIHLTGTNGKTSADAHDGRAARGVGPVGRLVHEPAPRASQRADRVERRADRRRRRSPSC